MESTAYGNARLTPTQFYDLTPWEFDRCLSGVQNALVEQWRIARWLAVTTITPHYGKKTPEPEKILPLPGDRRKTIPVVLPKDDFIKLFTKSFS